MTKILYRGPSLAREGGGGVGVKKTEINKTPKIKINRIKKRGILKIEFKKIPPIKEKQKYKKIFEGVIKFDNLSSFM